MHLLRSSAALSGLLLILFFSDFAQNDIRAQAPTIKVAVSVFDSATKAPLARAAVQLLEPKRGAYTNDKGVATILAVRPGQYTLKVTQIGYTIYTSPVQVFDSIHKLTVYLSARVGDSVITIEANRLMVEKSKTDVGRKFSQSEIINTPGRQRLEEIVKLTPGVTQDNTRVDINGGRSYQNGLKINGVETSDVSGSGSVVQNSASKFAISELNISTNGVDQNMGGVINTQIVPNNESYKAIQESPYKLVTQEPLSTFSIDVDRASYANVRRFLTSNQLPPRDAVRIEEMINYFHYDLPQPHGSDPIAIFTDMAACSWNTKHRIIQVALKGREIAKDDLPPANLVFLIDVSGSMNSPDKLPLLKSAFRLLVEQLREQDRVA
ncbi:MAG TPA: von Willebrand factor type A domain-containing protein, partial [Candidatus Kapabacteria bacterium]|nr:von Willebrand factor type A domain-containing protein [Candidatus Kapabacteria bacterium]